MSRYQITAGRIRWWLLAGVICCWLAALYWVFAPLPSNRLTDLAKPGGLTLGRWGLEGVMGLFAEHQSTYFFSATIVAGFFLLSQWLFLCPSHGWRIRIHDNGRPLRLSVMVAALMAALLSVGFLATLAELIGVWDKLIRAYNHGTQNGMTFRSWPLLLVLAALWALWAVIFFLYWRADSRGTQLERTLRVLFAGSILELLVSAPVHVMILRSKSKGECYCETGSYTGLVLGGTVLLWTFGPGIVLLFLHEAARRGPLLRSLPLNGQSPGTGN